MVTKDLSGTITSWNAGAERLFGYTAEEVIDKPINSSLAQQIVKRQFGGTLAYDWKPEGLVVRLSLPKDRLES